MKSTEILKEDGEEEEDFKRSDRQTHKNKDRQTVGQTERYRQTETPSAHYLAIHSKSLWFLCVLG